MTIIWDHIMNGVYMGWQITLSIFVVVYNSVCSFKGISFGYLIMIYNSGLGTSNLGVINGHFRDPICRGTICKVYGSAMWGIFLSPKYGQTYSQWYHSVCSFKNWWCIGFKHLHCIKIDAGYLATSKLELNIYNCDKMGVKRCMYIYIYI